MISVTNLNENQREAVLSEDKYIRIIAGAGSGKTRVLITRIAHLIEDKGVYPNKILAITFTNKAANEMKERIRGMLGDKGSGCWISTIHSLCVRILREDILTMGYPRNFTVMDAEDQKSVLREAYKELNVDKQKYPVSSVLGYISNNKSADISVERAYLLAGAFSGEKTKAQLYEYYCKRQKELYALDFDDLLLWTVRMFRTYSEVLNKWNKRFSYIHVDEFQDIDKIQYELIALLTGDNNDLYVVGDPDQTIYTWRGADVNIIMNFEKDFKPCRSIILNQNYRSTTNILEGANSLIKNNRNRIDKDLFSEKSDNRKITHFTSAGDEYEAAWVANTIVNGHRKGKSYKDYAILYRSNYLSRAIEKALLEQRIPYVIFGGVKFYERAEIKDVLSYMRLINGQDDLAFQRIINVPKRGLGNKSIDQIREVAIAENKKMYDVILEQRLFKGKTQQTMDSFVAMIERWREDADKIPVFELMEKVINESGYRMMLEESREFERIENLKELINDVKSFTEEYPDSTLDEYLQLVTLYGDKDEQVENDYVRLMTVHASKGLEFDTVFVVGMNEGTFPSERAMQEGHKGVEEERRLAYVAYTRAKNKLYLSDSKGFSYVLQRSKVTSRFVNEVDDRYIEHIGADVDRPKEPNFNNTFASSSESVEVVKNRPSAGGARRLKKGQHVVHALFGEGVVVSVVSGTATIAFPYPHGVKKIIEGHPSLRRKEDLN